MLNQLPTKTKILWIALCVPAVYLLVEKFVKDIPGDRFFGLTGEISVWLMFLTLAQTPAERLFRGQAWIRSLRPYRRHLGVAAFAYAGLHTAYWLYAVDPAQILESFSDPVLITGWLPFFGMAAMAITSNEQSVRMMGPRWKQLQRTIYFSAPLVVLHWLLVYEFETGKTVTYGGLLCLWIVLRLVTSRSGNRLSRGT